MDIFAMPWAVPTPECTSETVQVHGLQTQKGDLLNLKFDHENGGSNCLNKISWCFKRFPPLVQQEVHIEKCRDLVCWVWAQRSNHIAHTWVLSWVVWDAELSIYVLFYDCHFSYINVTLTPFGSYLALSPTATETFYVCKNFLFYLG